MSLFVALQSVLYYVLACSACRQCAYQRKRKQEALLGTKQRQRQQQQQQQGAEGDVEAEGGGNENTFYRHTTTSPFSTNIYWREELALGPGPPQQKSRSGRERGREKGKAGKGSHHHQQLRRQLTTGGTGSSVASLTSTGHGGESSSSGGHLLEGGGGGVAASAAAAENNIRTEDWYHRRYQRDDEVLWGHQHSQRAAVGHSDNGVLLHGRPEKTSYTRVRGGPLTELHPPVVSRHSSDRDEMQWMLQPPPRARIMSGKERVNGRDRSGSGGSSRTMTGDLSLGRQLGVRLMEDKRRLNAAAAAAAGTFSRERLGAQQMTAGQGQRQGQRHDRDVISRLADDETSSRWSRERSPPPPIWITEDSPRSSGETGIVGSRGSLHPDGVPRPIDPSSPATHYLQPSTSSLPPSTTSPTNSFSSQHPQHILQELLPPNNTNNTAYNVHSSPPTTTLSSDENQRLRPSSSLIVTEKHDPSAKDAADAADAAADDDDEYHRRRMRSLMLMNRWSMDI
ncbi:MAG: hypothetical protein M1816_005027 [Peltula sp. TS41687]|nr:MAG: hypothetical protein M1816_005027 [Peltula sp. TS41687]